MEVSMAIKPRSSRAVTLLLALVRKESNAVLLVCTLPFLGLPSGVLRKSFLFANYLFFRPCLQNALHRSRDFKLLVLYPKAVRICTFLANPLGRNVGNENTSKSDRHCDGREPGGRLLKIGHCLLQRKFDHAFRRGPPARGCGGSV